MWQALVLENGYIMPCTKNLPAVHAMDHGRVSILSYPDVFNLFRASQRSNADLPLHILGPGPIFSRETTHLRTLINRTT